jgi:hypothetical protein
VRYETYFTSSLPSKLEIAIYECDTEKAPSRVDSTVHHLCNITSKIDVSFNSLPKETNENGLEYRTLRYSVEMRTEEAALHFDVCINGVKQGGSKVDVKFMEGESQFSLGPELY